AGVSPAPVDARHLQPGVRLRGRSLAILPDAAAADAALRAHRRAHPRAALRRGGVSHLVVLERAVRPLSHALHAAAAPGGGGLAGLAPRSRAARARLVRAAVGAAPRLPGGAR